MSNKAINWAWELEDLPKSPTMMLIVLADQASDEGVCWPKLETLARKTRDSVRTVQRNIKFLEDAGLIQIHTRSTQDGRLSNLYLINVGAEYSAPNKQHDKMSCCETDETTTAVDNPTFPRESTNTTKCHVAKPPVDNYSQPDTSDIPQHDTSVMLLPYGENPHMEPPTNQAPAGATPGGVVGDDSPRESTPPDGEARPDWGLLDGCLPSPMRAGLSKAAGVTVTKALRAAEAAGWTRSQIYRNLNENPLPESMRNRTGLVIHRVQAVATTPPPTVKKKPPRPLAEAPQKAAKREPPPQWVKDFFREKYPEHFRQKDSTPRKEIA